MLYDPKKYPPTEVDGIGALLLKAAEYLDETGWCQRVFRDNQGQNCIAGAVALAKPTPGSYGLSGCSLDPVLSEMLDRIQEALGVHEWGEVVAFNDAEGRTKEEIQALLRRAAYVR
jgi:hypothetical protein